MLSSRKSTPAWWRFIERGREEVRLPLPAGADPEGDVWNPGHQSRSAGGAEVAGYTPGEADKPEAI
jgi:hypothetical protein